MALCDPTRVGDVPVRTTGFKNTVIGFRDHKYIVPIWDILYRESRRGSTAW
jgi:hypothetical protein